MIDEVNNILMCNENDDYISLYNIYKTLESIVFKQEELRNLYVDKMNIKLRNKYNPNYYLDKDLKIVICAFDYDQDELCIVLKNTLNLYEKYYFSNVLGKFKITESKNDFNRKKIDIIMEDLEGLYNSYNDIKRVYKVYYKEIEVLNSNFLLDINLNTLNLYLKNDTLNRTIDIRLYTYSREHFIDALKDVQEYIEDNYYELINKAKIKKMDCPSWIKKKL